MKTKGPVKVTLVKGCVVREAGEGKSAKDFKALDSVTVSQVDARFLIACGNAVDPKSEEGEEAIAAAKAAQPKATKK